MRLHKLDWNYHMRKHMRVDLYCIDILGKKLPKSRPRSQHMYLLANDTDSTSKDSVDMEYQKIPFFLFNFIKLNIFNLKKYVIMSYRCTLTRISIIVWYAISTSATWIRCTWIYIYVLKID